MAEVKLTKKEKKALQFRKSKEERDDEKEVKKQKKQEEEEKKKDEKEVKKRSLDSEDTEEAPKKKRKTRRGKKGKGVNGGKGPRFILFAGNLPYDVTEEELNGHFKNCKPDRIRIRKDKGIAFLEFDNDTKEIQKKMELALRLHHSTLKNRKINVELTVGGGGNSENRVKKLKEKNDKLVEERKQRILKEDKEKRAKEGSAEVKGGIHPSRAALIGS